MQQSLFLFLEFMSQRKMRLALQLQGALVGFLSPQNRNVFTFGSVNKIDPCWGL